VREFAIPIHHEFLPDFSDGDWLFATTKGRRCLRRQCARHRLAVVRLFRDQEYQGGLEAIKEELGKLARDFAPAKAFGQKVKRKKHICRCDRAIA
jgi:hypothetical protein